MDAPELNLLEMLRTGQSLPSAALPSIRDREMNLTRRAKELQRELEDTLAGIRHCKGLLAPVRALPREILLHIFFLTGDTSIQPMGARAVILRVCHHWRAIVTSSPDLWSTIDISIPKTFTADLMTPILSVLAQCLVLSHPRPLDISVDFNAHRDDIERKILELLLYHTSRWRSYTHRDVYEGIQFLFDLFLRLERLEDLSLEHQGEYEQLYLHFDVPSLRTFNTSFAIHPEWTVLQSSALLTTLHCILDDDWDCYSLLSKMLNLSALHIKHIALAQEIEPEPPTITPLCLKHLRTLTLETCAISPVLQHFTFPSLEKLSIPTGTRSFLGINHYTPCAIRQHVESVTIIKDLIYRSQCPLRALDLSSYIPPTNFLPLFALCALTLTSLHVSFHDNMSSNLSLIRMFTIEDTTASPILPHLTDLAFTANMFSRVFELEDSETMINSRLDVKAGIARLERLRLERDHLAGYTGVTSFGFKISSLSISLRKLAKQGLDVTWIIHGEDILKDGEYNESALHL